MPQYTPPVRDTRFVLEHVVGLSRYANVPGFSAAAPDTVDAVLEEGGRFVAEVLFPLNQSGDQEGCTRHEDGSVTTPAGFKEAYKQFVESGWGTLSAPEAFGGQGMPHVISTAFQEYMISSNMAFAMYPGLAHGAIAALVAKGSPEQQEKYLPKMVSGEWGGTMNLTEPQCGTDLGLIRTRAEPQADGSYKITGTKIFISAGEHDLTENIIHLVLAKLPDAPAGPKGISLFLVPKVMVNADGSLGERNAVSCGSIEHKMGIKASATCVMNFDGATGYLVGEVNKGLAAMFTMMNYERLSIGIQGIGCAEASYQNAVTYARERIQSRAPSGPQATDKAADPIIVHPDVRRMLLTIKAMTEGGRAFACYVGQQLDLAKYADDADERSRAEALVALLTPVAKAFFTDTGLDSCIHGQQVFGGHGYIREWGQEQLVRDVRIAQIYEGTNGIQALDLLGRKVAAGGGASLQTFCAEMEAWAARGGLYADELKDAVQRLRAISGWLLEQARSNPNEIGAASVEYLHLFGYTAYAYMWARMADCAAARRHEDEHFHAGKLASAEFFFRRLLPRCLGLEACIRGGSAPLFGHDAEQF